LFVVSGAKGGHTSVAAGFDTRPTLFCQGPIRVLGDSISPQTNSGLR
jgi:hypothetical protein